VTVAIWKARNQIHGYMGKWFGIDFGWDSEQWSFDSMCKVFVLLTCGATFDVFRYPCPGARPKVFLIDFPYCFVSTGMSAEGSVVPRVHDFAFQSLVRGYDKSLCGGVTPE
jgi:hypothetical protein